MLITNPPYLTEQNSSTTQLYSTCLHTIIFYKYGTVHDNYFPHLPNVQ